MLSLYIMSAVFVLFSPWQLGEAYDAQSFALVCYPKQKYQEIDPLTYSCPPTYVTLEQSVLITYYVFLSPRLPDSACLCDKYELTRECESNFLWSVKTWHNIRKLTPTLDECTEVCRKAQALKSSIRAPKVVPLNCPWWSYASNVSIYYTASLLTAVYHPVSNRIDCVGETSVACHLRDNHCILSTGSVVVPSDDLLRTDCNAHAKSKRGWLRLDGIRSGSIRISETEELWSFSNICSIKICDIEGVLSDEGILVDPIVFPAPVKPCNAQALVPREDHMLAHTEFINNVARTEIAALSRSLCQVSFNLITVLLTLRKPVPSDLLHLLDTGSQASDSLVVRDGKLYQKPCIRVKLYNYTQECPGVWVAATSRGNFYADRNLPELTERKPECLLAENTTHLPGGYVVVRHLGAYHAIPGGRKHHLVIWDLSHRDDEVLLNEKQTGPVHSSVSGESQSGVFSYHPNGPDWSKWLTWLKGHSFVIGLVGTITIIVGATLVIYMAVTCKRLFPRLRTKLRRPRVRQNSFQLMNLNNLDHPGSPSPGFIM